MEVEERLIDANEALRMMLDSKIDNPYSDTIGEVIWKLAHDCAKSCVDACPTVDARKVVQCKNCKKGYKRNKESSLNFVWCEKWRNIMRPYDFCSFGEEKNYDRRENDPKE